MNTSVIRYLLGYILKLEGFLLLLPCIVAGIYYEKSGIYFLIVALISIAIGFIFSAKKPRDFTFYLKEGCATTALGWIVLSIFGCLPFYISGEIPSFTDALFETISGFTTTGASILPEVESLSYCMNFWRCFTHWIGGMGVLVFLLAIIPLSGGRKPRAFGWKARSKDEAHCQAFIHNILWSYDYRDCFPSFRKNASLRCHLYLPRHSRNRWLWYQKRQLLRLQCLSAMGCYHIYDTFRSQFQRLLPAFLRSHP